MLPVRVRRERGRELGAAGTAQGGYQPSSPARPDTVRPTVHALERPGPDRIVKSWRQAGGVSYRKQLWIAATATVGGICAMSGRVDELGHAGFKPIGSPVPFNIAERFRASGVVHIPDDEIVQ
ncbi:DUF3331 domain-containing protein [Burkholderia sp. SCN-KJ]|uniref:DUF3331 domain-containing protein n=1 Tax=Burkholderia sp. SCN-KJ TaxID=2969248 RepID=UPI00214F6A0E|nr:DUF3331 domain-containing protein [Burkholderia sp. SCN-KJ]MCR4470447.1 DUF3331 domain-containing protein [Burkholderia sp. SCN-KJ]